MKIAKQNSSLPYNQYTKDLGNNIGYKNGQTPNILLENLKDNAKPFKKSEIYGTDFNQCNKK